MDISYYLLASLQISENKERHVTRICQVLVASFHRWNLDVTQDRNLFCETQENHWWKQSETGAHQGPNVFSYFLLRSRLYFSRLWPICSNLILVCSHIKIISSNLIRSGLSIKNSYLFMFELNLNSTFGFGSW